MNIFKQIKLAKKNGKVISPNYMLRIKLILSSNRRMKVLKMLNNERMKYEGETLYEQL